MSKFIRYMKNTLAVLGAIAWVVGIWHEAGPFTLAAILVILFLILGVGIQLKKVLTFVG